MDSPSTPSIMGSENPKFTERRDERSESDSVDLNMNGDMAHRKSKGMQPLTPSPPVGGGGVACQEGLYG